MSKTKDRNFDALLNVAAYILSSEEKHLIDDVDRCMHEIKVSACNYAEAVRKLDKFRTEQASRRVDTELKAGNTPF